MTTLSRAVRARPRLGVAARRRRALRARVRAARRPSRPLPCLPRVRARRRGSSPPRSRSARLERPARVALVLPPPRSPAGPSRRGSPLAAALASRPASVAATLAGVSAGRRAPPASPGRSRWSPAMDSPERAARSSGGRAPSAVGRPARSRRTGQDSPASRYLGWLHADPASPRTSEASITPTVCRRR